VEHPFVTPRPRARLLALLTNIKQGLPGTNALAYSASTLAKKTFITEAQYH